MNESGEYSIYWSADNLVAHTVYQGPMTIDILRQSYAERVDSDVARFAQARYLINDHSASDFTEISSAHVREIADLAKRAASLNAEILIAGIMGSGLGYGLARMWQAYTDDLPWTSMPLTQ